MEIVGDTLTRYIVSRKNCAIYFDDKRKHVPRCGRHEMIQMYLKGLVKLIIAVNENEDWQYFGKCMEALVEELRDKDDKGEKACQ